MKIWTTIFEIALAAALCLFAAACTNDMWWEYRDDPFIADMSRRPTQEVIRGVNGINKDERQVALRILADRAGEMRRAGRGEIAREYEEIITRRYFVEKEQEVRACIVRLAAPSVGRGSTHMVRFLRDRIAAGEFPGFAALSLASLAPKDAVMDIEPLTRHPAPEVRLQAATALCVLADPRGFEAVERVWRGMRKAVWPDRIDGLSLEEARSSLEARARRTFGRELK